MEEEASFLYIVKDDPEAIMSLVTIMKKNFEQGKVPNPTPGQIPFRKAVVAMIEKILSHKNKIEENRQLIVDLYDDLLDELINAGLGRGFM
jgi:hypothetical protein